MIGHTRARLLLEGHLPPAALISGPPGIGKRTLVTHLLDHHRVAWYDLLRNDRDKTFTIDDARHATEFARRAPYNRFKVIAVHLDDASPAAVNALLKTVEEPPPTVRFLFTAARSAMPTIASRCEHYPLGLLSHGELLQILQQLGMPRTRAEIAAHFGHGRIDQAVAVDRTGSSCKAAVIELARAIALHDRESFHRAFRAWDEVCDELLTRWFTEAISGLPGIFTAEETFGLGRDRGRLMAMIAALSQVSSARTRLSARAALEPFV